jgi:hypothetical protein
MKRSLLILLFFITYLCSIAQTPMSQWVSVVKEQKFVLEGGASATFIGRSRNFIEFSLPENTQEWYYSITTAPASANGQMTLGLISKLSRFVDPTGLSSMALSQINIPQGKEIMDVYSLIINSKKIILMQYINPFILIIL